MNYLQKRTDEHITSRLLPWIWRLEPPGSPDPDALNKYEARAYFNHYKGLLCDASLIQEEEITIGRMSKQCDNVAELVGVVRQNWDRPISEIKAALVSSGKPCWLVRENDPALSKIIDFAVRLWLFVPLHVDQITRKPRNERADAWKDLDATTIQTKAQRCMPPRRILPGNLSFDLNLENLVKKAKLDFRPTGMLHQHLMMEGPYSGGSTVIHVFCHVRALEKYQDEAHRQVLLHGYSHVKKNNGDY